MQQSLRQEFQLRRVNFGQVLCSRTLQRRNLLLPFNKCKKMFQSVFCYIVITTGSDSSRTSVEYIIFVNVTADSSGYLLFAF